MSSFGLSPPNVYPLLDRFSKSKVHDDYDISPQYSSQQQIPQEYPPLPVAVPVDEYEDPNSWKIAEVYVDTAVLAGVTAVALNFITLLFLTGVLPAPTFPLINAFISEVPVRKKRSQDSDGEEEKNEKTLPGHRFTSFPYQSSLPFSWSSYTTQASSLPLQHTTNQLNIDADSVIKVVF